MVEQAFLSAKPSLFGGVLWPAFTRLVGVKFGAAGVPQTPPSVSLSLTSRCGASPVLAKAFIVLAFRRFSCGSGGGGEERCEGAGNFA